MTEEKLTLDGAEAKSEFMHSPRVTAARMSADGRQLDIVSTISLAWGPPGSKLVVRDAWTLDRHGEVLTIRRSADSFMGKQESTMVFERR